MSAIPGRAGPRPGTWKSTMLSPKVISCLLVPLGILVGQVFVLAGLAGAVRRGERPLNASVAMHVGIWLVALPGFELLLYATVLVAAVGHARDPILRFIQQYGGFPVVGAWTVLAIPTCRLLARPKRLSRARGALAAPIGLALLAAALSASHVAGAAVYLAETGGLEAVLLSGPMMTGLIVALNVLLLAVTSAQGTQAGGCASCSSAGSA